ncbi:protein S100-P-like [Bombina bombina]|uniref:protein S100-P-like n=1 Tax=Bombina bombina TaxID=8345 RepID=UPI00235AF805|nr:protein S100-P-like [Bombina bombina]
MTELETAIVMIIDVFDRYSCTEGNRLTLTKGEMKTLLEKELPGILSNAKEKDASEKILKDLDANGDSEVDFNEFIILVAALTCLGHKKFEEMQQNK